MTNTPVELTEDRIPFDGIEEAIDELVDLYGGEIIDSRERERRFVLPIRRGMPSAGAVECTLAWSADDDREATVQLVCDRDVDAPKAQRIALLVAGVVGSVLFMLWPFVHARREFGALAWIGGAIMIAVYFMTRRRTSGGIASDFLARLARHQRAGVAEATDVP